MRNTGIKPDVIFKNFWRDNGHFASLFNTVVFGGKTVIQPEALKELDTDVSNVIKSGKYEESLTRTRDLVKKAAHDTDFVILGIENQRKIHYGMPLRVMIYDALSYLKECQEIAGKHKEAGDKATAEEFLSGLHKGDRLHPIITIVLYYDEKLWDGAQSLKDMIGDMPSEISGVFSDYRMNLLQVRESSQYHFDNEDVQTIFEITRYIYQGEFAKVKKFYGEKTVKSDVGAVIGVMADSSLIVEEALESEGGMNMCTALEKLEEKGREEGRLEMKQETVLSMANLGMPVEQIAAVVKESVGIVQKWISEGKAAV
ncbi:hypothetical protein [Mordavella massiliensis]|uniref:hypothetical protein n=1 Tax=Mordavella massiliensis TaxID=1871024 RepID=UPI00210887D3|nr:hypothetical protein [Mordavella massiliensis]